jgi:hypothetical protein
LQANRTLRPVEDVVLLRSIYAGKVRWTFPHRVVDVQGDTAALYCCPGSPGKLTRRLPGEGYLERWVRPDTEPTDHVWHSAHVLRLVTLGAEHTVELFWDEQWRFQGWYLNLVAPVRRSAAGFDTTDRVLDVWVEPGGSWQWKDEDELEQAIALGVFDDDGAAHVRRVGEAAIAAHPWPTGWEDWRPDPAWPVPQLPEGWDVV